MKTGLLGLLWLMPTLGGLAVSRLRTRRVALGLATLLAALVSAIGVVVFLSTATHALHRWSGVDALFGHGVDGLSAILLPIVGLLTLGSLIAMPRSTLDVRSIAGALITAGATLGVLVSANVLVFAAFWALSVAPLRGAANRSGDPALLRAVQLLERVSVAPLCAAALCAAGVGASEGIPWSADIGTLATSSELRAIAPVLGAVVLVSALARLGTFPFHTWVPVALTRGPSVVAPFVVISPLGSFALVRLLLAFLPDFFFWVHGLLLWLGAASAIYGSLLALGQHDARRQLGYVWVSVAGMVVMGLGGFEVHGMSGALLHEIAALLSVSGLLWITAAIDARVGTVDMRRLGGLVRRAPWLATAYLLLAIATVGIPGTVTFVSEDLLVEGLLHDHAPAAVLLLVTSALNGVTLLRSFKRIFLGPPSPLASDSEHVEDTLPRERWAVALLVLALLAGGLVPTPVLSVRAGVARSLHRPRDDRQTDVAPTIELPSRAAPASTGSPR